MHTIVISLAVFFSLWAACGFFAYGAANRWWETEFPGLAHKGVVWMCAIGGPFGLLVAFLMGDQFRRGFQWRRSA